VTSPTASDNTGVMLGEIHRMIGELSSKMGTVLSDMAYIKEDVTEHKREIRALNGLPAEVLNLRAELVQVRSDFETRIRLLERDKMPKAQLTLLFGLVTTVIAVLVFLGVSK
jgi:hypothetical protein